MILDRILEHKRAELRHKQSQGYLKELKAKIRDVGHPLGFADTLDATRTPQAPALIAEVKKASPSLGLLRPEFEEQFDPVAIAQTYREHGASAVSVLTDEEFFKGSLEYLRQVKSKVGLPRSADSQGLRNGGARDTRLPTAPQRYAPAGRRSSRGFAAHHQG